MKKSRFYLLIAAALMFRPLCAAAQDGNNEQPFVLGPVMINFMEKVETHSHAPLPQGKYGKNTFVLSTFVMSRVIGRDVTAMFTLTNKYGDIEEAFLTNISGIAIQKKVNKRMNYSLSYTNVTNPKATIAGLERPMSTSDWFAVATDYTVAANKVRSLKANVSMTTSTGFDSGQMVTGRLAFRNQFGKKVDAELAYQAVYGLKDAPAAGQFKGLYATNYQASLGYKLDKVSKLQIAYQYLANKYPGNPGDNRILRANVYRMFKSK